MCVTVTRLEGVFKLREKSIMVIVRIVAMRSIIFFFFEAMHYKLVYLYTHGALVV